MVDPTYPLFPIFSFLGFVLALVPLPWHLEAWNSATCYYMMWASLSCLNEFVNTVVWARDALDHAPVWCDVCECPLSLPLPSCCYIPTAPSATRITIAASVGIPAASMCINQRLYNIAKVQAVMVTKAEVSIFTPLMSLSYS